MTYSELLDKVEQLQKTNDRLQKENESLKRIRDTFMRQVKERSNKEKGQFPKKQHSGYSLISSCQKEYRYYDGGRKSIWIYETVLQSPYSIDYSYHDVIYNFHSDMTAANDDELSLIEQLGLLTISDDKTYLDLRKGDTYKQVYKECRMEYLEKHNKTDIWPEDIDEVLSETKKKMDKVVYNANARANGRDGYWEVSFNHLIPMTNIPVTMRFARIKAVQKKENASKKK